MCGCEILRSIHGWGCSPYNLCSSSQSTGAGRSHAKAGMLRTPADWTHGQYLHRLLHTSRRRCHDYELLLPAVARWRRRSPRRVRRPRATTRPNSPISLPGCRVPLWPFVEPLIPSFSEGRSLNVECRPSSWHGRRTDPGASRGLFRSVPGLGLTGALT